MKVSLVTYMARLWDVYMDGRLQRAGKRSCVEEGRDDECY